MPGVHHRAGDMLALLSMSILPGCEGYMAVRKIALIIKGSMLLIAAAALAGCGGDGSGGSTVNVPNVVGDTQAAAGTAITDAGLTVGTVTQASSATVASGNVTTQSPAAA